MNTEKEQSIDRTAEMKESEREIFELIREVKSGRHESFEILRSRYLPLISDMAKSFEESGSGNRADLLEDAQRAFLRAAVTFDETKEGITFGLYAKVCIRNALISVRRAERSRRKKEERASKKEAVQRAKVLTSFGDMEAEEILERIESVLSEYEALVLREYFSGRSAKETAAVLGTDEKSVNNAVYRIRTKAKQLGDTAAEK